MTNLQWLKPYYETLKFYLDKLSSLTVPVVLVLGFLSLSWSVDWVRVEDWTRNGKVIFSALFFGAIGAIYISRRFHWTVALFFLYTAMRWFTLRLAPVSMIEVFVITGTIFAAIFIHQEDERNLLGTVVVFDAVVQSIVGLIEVAGYFPFHQINPEIVHMVWPPIAFHGNPTILGPFLAVSLAFIPGVKTLFKNPDLDLTWRVMSALLITTCIIFTKSTMTSITLLVVVMAGIGVYLGWRAFLLTSSALSVAGAFILWFYPAASSTSGRWQHWVWAWNHSVFWGYGPGTWKPVAIQKHVQEWQYFLESKKLGMVGNPPGEYFAQLHNGPLQGLFEFGWPGMIPLFIGTIIIGWITCKAITNKRRDLFPWVAVFWGLLFNSGGNFILQTFPCALIFAVAAIKLFRYQTEEEYILSVLKSLEEEEAYSSPSQVSSTSLGITSSSE